MKNWTWERKNRRKDRPVRRERDRRGLALIILIIVVILAVLGGLTKFITDWMWFGELGYTKVFWTEIKTEVIIWIPVMVVSMLLVRLYLKSLRNGYFRDVESHEIPDIHRLNVISWALAVVFGLIAATAIASNIWMEYLKFTNSTDFDLKDPLFGLDVSFYVFKLAFLQHINNMVLLLIIGIIFVTLIYYAILLSVRTPDFFGEEDDFGGDDEYSRPDNSIPFGRKRQTPFDGMFGGSNGNQTWHRRQVNMNDQSFGKLLDIASGKLTILGVIFYIMVAVDFFLKQFDLLHAHTGTVYGAGYTDVNVKLWLYRIMIVMAIIGAVTLFAHMKKAEFRKLLRVPAAMIIIFAVGSLTGAAVQNFVVSPDEISKETKYLRSNISFTRHAYGLDNVHVKSFSADNSLTAADIDSNSQTISNVRINDYEPVKDYYNQTQSIRQYYDFNDVDIDRYTINGEETQTYLSPREINESNISDTWLNRHLKYTHGYGVAVSQVDAVTASGQPDVIVKNIPPESSVSALKITRPEIYFGELTNDYSIVGTDENEFDYPDGNANKYTRYKGRAGIKLTPFRRLLFSIREGSMKMLVSSNIDSNSRIIINRNVLDRVKQIMPYLSYEKDPYMTVVDGRLYWIIDAYTTSSYYPYSEPYSGEVGSTNYIRNSVKVVVDAYNGDVNYYIVDHDDPIAQTMQKIYPTLFKSDSEMPAGIKEHIRYPNTLLGIQADVYTKYHMKTVKVFYQNEDLWDIAHQIYGTEEKEMEPSYYIFQLPGEKKAEFVNMIPFTPKSKQNMTAIMLARNDNGEYGDLVVYKFPKNKTVYGPMQIEAQIDQSTEISKEFSLWNSSGSTYRRGDLFVIPIDNSILYVEPVYLEASNQAIPEVKRVIVAYNDNIAYESTFADALDSLFGDTSAGETGSSSSGGSSSKGSSQKELISKANDAYDNAVQARKDGDWEAYGKYLDKLSDYLNELEENE